MIFFTDNKMQQTKDDYKSTVIKVKEKSINAKH